MADESIQAIETVIPTLPQPLAGALAPSPYSFEFTGEDRLRLTVFNSVAGVKVAAHFRMHRPGARTHASRDEFTPTSTRLASTKEIELGAGYLLNVTCFASSGSPKIGQTFVKLQVIRGSGASATVLGTILQDYVTANQDLAWPGSPMRSSIDGGGLLRYITGTDPAGGTEISETVPTGARWQLIHISIQFATGASGTERTLVLRLDDGANQYLKIPATVKAFASTNLNWYWSVMPSQAAAINPAIFNTALPNGITLLEGHRIQTETDGLWFDDNYAAPRYTVREWLEAQ